MIKLTYFEDFGILGCEKNIILIDFRLFCNLSARGWGSRGWGTRNGGLEIRQLDLGPPISDLNMHLPVLKKHYRGPLNVNVV